MKHIGSDFIVLLDHFALDKHHKIALNWPVTASFEFTCIKEKRKAGQGRMGVQIAVGVKEREWEGSEDMVKLCAALNCTGDREP